MEYIGRVLQNKDIVTKEYVDNIAGNKTGVVTLVGVENSTTATSAYSIGDYLRYIDSNNAKQIAEVTSAISSGGTIANGTNVENLTITSGSDLSITLTKALYDLLSNDEKNDPDRFYYIDDIYVTGADIDDTTTAQDSTWSSYKINLEISQLSGSLAGLDDVDISNPSGGQALLYDSTSSEWKNGNISTTLSGLTDTTISNPADGQVLTYDSSTGKWDNENLPASGHTILPTPDASNPPSESAIATAVNAATGGNENIASLWGIQNWSNTMTKRIVYNGTIAVNATGIGTWQDTLNNPTAADEAGWGWWYDAHFVGIDAYDDYDIRFKFDPSNGEIIVLGGYILDTTTGYLCIKFASPIKNTGNKIAVDITIMRNNVSYSGGSN